MRQNARKRSITSRARAILAFLPQTLAKKVEEKANLCVWSDDVKYHNRNIREQLYHHK